MDCYEGLSEMITLTFETKQFRVQISGKTAWVESSERGCWVFRSQHTVPIAADALRRRNRAGMLASVVKHFAAHGGDQGLREALTGVRVEDTKTAPMKPAQALVEAKASPKLGLPTRLSTTPQSDSQRSHSFGAST
jgi:hypothetical protein